MNGSVVKTAVVAAVLVAVAIVSAPRNDALLWLAISMGGLGGLTHEYAQSGWKVFGFARRNDGVYLGAVGALLVGVIVGLVTVNGPFATTTMTAAHVSYQSFTVALGAKGLAEAVFGKPVSAKQP